MVCVLSSQLPHMAATAKKREFHHVSFAFFFNYLCNCDGSSLECSLHVPHLRMVSHLLHCTCMPLLVRFHSIVEVIDRKVMLAKSDQLRVLFDGLSKCMPCHSFQITPFGISFPCLIYQIQPQVYASLSVLCSTFQIHFVLLGRLPGSLPSSELLLNTDSRRSICQFVTS